MLFKELKVGMPVYYFDRKNIIAITGKVTMNPSMPHADGKMSWQQLVVDVPVQLGDKITSFVLPDNQDTAYPDGAVVSTNRDVVLREIESMMALNEQELNKIEQRKDIVEKCKALLCDFNPLFKEKQQNDIRFDNIEKRIDGFGSKIDRLFDMIKKFSE